MIGHISRRNCLIKRVMEGTVRRMDRNDGRRGRRPKKVLDFLKEKTRYWKLKEEAADRTVWRTRCGRAYGPAIRHRAAPEDPNSLFKKKIDQFGAVASH